MVRLRALDTMSPTMPEPAMNRVFRGALFPILIVIVLAFFVSKLLSPSSSSGVIRTTTQRCHTRPARPHVTSFTVDTSSNTINVTLKNKTRYSVTREQQLDVISRTYREL